MRRSAQKLLAAGLRPYPLGQLQTSTPGFMGPTSRGGDSKEGGREGGKEWGRTM